MSDDEEVQSFDDEGEFPVRQLSPSQNLKLEADHLGRYQFQTPCYTSADQTIIFYDWDETLFPTETILRDWGLEVPRKSERMLTAAQENDLKAWRKSLREVLEKARSLSSNVCIVTNATRPWVDDSVKEFAPELIDFINTFTKVYAREHLRNTRSLLYRRLTQVNPARHGSEPSDLEVQSALTLAKYFAMKDVASKAYSQYEHQTWKNILSFGDSAYECDALRDVAFRRVPPKHKDERLRAKCLLLPTCPSVSELALRLRFHREVLQAYVEFDGDFDLDLTAANDPLSEIGKALSMPELASLPWLSHAWGIERAPQEKDAEFAIAAVKAIVEEHCAKNQMTIRTGTPTTTAGTLPPSNAGDTESLSSLLSTDSPPESRPSKKLLHF
jgi:hypothetical protein